MTRLTPSFVSLAVVALVAGCSPGKAPAPVASDSGAAGPVADAASEAPAPSASAMPEPSPSASATSAAKEIPVALRGHWGMVPGDCDPSTGADKGAVTIAATSMRFFESRAKLGTIKAVTPSRLEASFAYEGEGMEWSRQVTLDAQNGGKVLILREYGDDAPPGPRRYERCPAG